MSVGLFYLYPARPRLIQRTCVLNFNKMIAKMKGVDKAAEDYRFTIFYDPDTDTYWVDNSLELFFENQEDVIARYLKENGYQLISMTGEK